MLNGGHSMSTYLGRRQLFTDYLPNKMQPEGSTAPTLDETSIPAIIKQVWATVQENGVEIEYLLNYYKGYQDILEREKIVRPDVDNKIVFNHAMAITRDIVGYTFGKPIRYVHRIAKARKDVSELNALVEAEDKFASDQELALYASICGTAYRGVFSDAYGVEDDIPFSIVTLNPITTFVVYSSEVGHAPVLACTFYEIPPSDTNANKHVYLVYTHDRIYRYETSGQSFGILEASDLVFSIDNPLDEIPIIEYPNNAFRIGDWEMAKTLLDAINVVGSDCVNNLEQFVNSILVAINVDLTPDDLDNIRANKIVSLVSEKELPAEMKYISEQLDANGSQALRDYLMEQLRLVVGIPARDSRAGGGGDTGDAVYLRDGFQDLEIVARTKETYFKRAERTTLKLIIKFMQKLAGEFKNLKTKDVDIRFSRNMTDGMLAKANAIAILHGSNILDPVDTLSLVGITTEPDDLVKRGTAYWQKQDKESPEINKTITAPKDEQLKRKVDRN